MMNKGDINKITNNYILKSLFAYLKYEKLLKLVNNHKGLQNRLGINLQNYKTTRFTKIIIFGLCYHNHHFFDESIIFILKSMKELRIPFVKFEESK